jgi:UDP-N-acetyl-2-amino-2-deoxyglucuronate dehydrogenase
MNKIKFAVIGAGHIGKRHADIISQHEDTVLCAVCDTNASLQNSLPLPVPFYTSFDELLSNHIDVEVVAICSPNGLHAEHALLALEHGKHVVIEKPMALTKSECEKVIFKALQVQRQVFCVMQNRYSPPSTWLKELVEKNVLGKIYMVHIDCFWNRDERYYQGHSWKGTANLDGGTLFTQFSHFIDMMYWLFGDIHNIHARFKDFNHATQTAFEDSGVVLFEFLNGALGSFNFSTAVRDKNFESTMTVIAENGTVKLGGQYMNEVYYSDITNYEMPELAPANPPNDYGHYKGSAANHHYIIQNVVETLRGQTKISTNALEGMKVVDIIERIYQSSTRILK